MPAFDAIGIAGTALSTNRKWMDAIADNLANANTATRTDDSAFRARYVEVAEAPNGQGVNVTATRFGDAEGRIVHEPDNPLADADGNVRYPDIDFGSQMSSLIMAQRAYQMNTQVVSNARTTYQAALEIGR